MPYEFVKSWRQIRVWLCIENEMPNEIVKKNIIDNKSTISGTGHLSLYLFLTFTCGSSWCSLVAVLEGSPQTSCCTHSANNIISLPRNKCTNCKLESLGLRRLSQRMFAWCSITWKLIAFSIFKCFVILGPVPTNVDTLFYSSFIVAFSQSF